MTQSRHGRLETERPERYAKQLAGHWSRKAEVGGDDATTTITFEGGNVVTMTPQEGRLDLRVDVPDDGDADRFAQVVAEHLERFGTRDELHVAWD